MSSSPAHPPAHSSDDDDDNLTAIAELIDAHVEAALIRAGWHRTTCRHWRKYHPARARAILQRERDDHAQHQQHDD